MKNKIKLIIWDLDGTLVDTDLYIVMNYTHLFKKYHHPYPSLEKMVYFSGPPLTDVLKEYFPEIPLSQSLEDFKAFSKRYINVYPTIYPYELEVLSKLKKEGYKMVVLSNKLRSGVIANLKHFNILPYIDDILGLDDCLRPKPDSWGVDEFLKRFKVNKDEAILIGDSLGDIKTGLNAKIKTALVTWGLKRKPEINYDEEFSSYKDIERYFIL